MGTGMPTTVAEQQGETTRHETATSKLTEFRAFANELGLEAAIQACMLGFADEVELAIALKAPALPVSQKVVDRATTLNKLHEALKELTETQDEMLELLFTPNPQAPLFGASPIRIMENGTLSDLCMVAEHFTAAANSDSFLPDPIDHQAIAALKSDS